MSEPTTKAGRALLANMDHGGDRTATRTERRAEVAAILAIEAEARDRALSDALAAVGGLDWGYDAEHVPIYAREPVRDAIEALRSLARGAADKIEEARG